MVGGGFFDIGLRGQPRYSLNTAAVVLDAAGTNSLTVSWSDPNNLYPYIGTGHRVGIRVAGSQDAYAFTDFAKGVLSHTFTGLLANTAYEFRYYPLGNPALYILDSSTVATHSTAAGNNTAPSWNNSLQSYSQNEEAMALQAINLDALCSDPEGQARTYSLSNRGDSYNNIGTLAVNGNLLNWTPISPAGRGAIDVTVTDSAGASAVIPFYFSVNPNIPTGLTATAGNNQVALAWVLSSNTYETRIFRSTSSGGAKTEIHRTTVAGTQAYTDTTAVNGTTYYYTVVAVLDSQGTLTGRYSAEASATPSAGAVVAQEAHVYGTDANATGFVTLSSSGTGTNNNGRKVAGGTAWNAAYRERAADGLLGSAITEYLQYQIQVPNIDAATNGLGMRMSICAEDDVNTLPDGYSVWLYHIKWQIRCIDRVGQADAGSFTSTEVYASNQIFGIKWDKVNNQMVSYRANPDGSFTTIQVFNANAINALVSAGKKLVFNACFFRQGNPNSEVLNVKKYWK